MKGIMEHQEVGAKRANSIIAIVAKVSGLQVRKLKSQSRKRQVVDVRRMCMNLIRCKLKLPTPVIGAIFDRDHATILFNIKQHEDLYNYDVEYKTLYDTLEIAIGLKADLGKEETLFIERLVARVEYLEKENEDMNVKIKQIKKAINE